ncbi:MAG: YbaB/EbfC family nucleoid-associated protein [Saprospiraceae bacterium]|nr:YbaB/EbfC family nucleoid-associated protein [Saprospiraceae bacterium]
MFGNLMGNMEERQAAMKERLAKIELEATAGDGAITIQMNGNNEVLNVSIDPSKLDWEDKEQVEDLMMVAVNRAIDKAKEAAAQEAQKMISEMLPPGMGDFGNLFG